MPGLHPREASAILSPPLGSALSERWCVPLAGATSGAGILRATLGGPPRDGPGASCTEQIGGVMYILVSGATKTVAKLMSQHPNLGVLVCPKDGNSFPDKSVVWAADNSAFSGFDDALFRRFLTKLAERPDCRWVTAPDVVGDAAATMRLWAEWAPLIRTLGLKPSLVAQDGLTVGDVPWAEVGGIFIGGTTRYKLSEAAAVIVGEATRRNVWAHMGRVNTAPRVLFAAAIGCRSVDGSGFSKWSATHLPWALRLARQEPLNLSGEATA